MLLLAWCVSAQGPPSNRITFSGGWTRDIGGLSFERQSATSLGLSYGRRVHRYIEAEGGLFTAIDPSGDECGHLGCVDIGDRYYWIPFGVRFIAPLAGRVELSGGGGGLYEKYTVGRQFPGGGPDPRSGWGGYFVAGAAVALDPGRHLWLGFTPRAFLANPPYARDRWLQIAGEISVRFR